MKVFNSILFDATKSIRESSNCDLPRYFTVELQQCQKYARVNLTFPRAEQFLCVFTVIDSSLVSSLAFVVSSTLSRASSPFSFLLYSAHFSLSCRLISCIFFIRGSAVLCSGSSGFVNSIPAFFSVDSFLPGTVVLVVTSFAIICFANCLDLFGIHLPLRDS